MEKRTAVRKGREKFLLAGLFCVLASLSFAAETRKTTAPKDDASVQDLTSILGPDSQLQAAPDGEFNFSLGADNQLENFRAVKDVILLTKDIDLRCDDLTFDRAKGLVTATAEHKGQVHITIRNMGAAGPTGKPTDTRATCGRYELYVTDKRHVLSLNPVIFQKDRDGKEAAIVGRVITMTQDKAGRWQMHVKGDPGIVDPKRLSELARARERMGNVVKPVVTVETVGPKTSETSATKPGAPTKAAQLDETNLEKAQQPKPTRVARLEEGG